MKYILIVLTALLLVSCTPYIKTDQVGTSMLPDGYELKEIYTGGYHVFVIFKDGLPYQGTGTGYSSGKTTANVSSLVVESAEDEIADLNKKIEIAKLKKQLKDLEK